MGDLWAQLWGLGLIPPHVGLCPHQTGLPASGALERGRPKALPCGFEG